jgi:hypothetical protein
MKVLAGVLGGLILAFLGTLLVHRSVCCIKGYWGWLRQRCLLRTLGGRFRHRLERNYSRPCFASASVDVSGFFVSASSLRSCLTGSFMAPPTSIRRLNTPGHRRVGQGPSTSRDLTSSCRKLLRLVDGERLREALPAISMRCYRTTAPTVSRSGRPTARLGTQTH